MATCCPACGYTPQVNEYDYCEPPGQFFELGVEAKRVKCERRCEMRYEVTRVFDACNGQTIEAETPEEAAEIAMNDGAASPSLCHQCSSDVNLGDHIRTIVYDEYGIEVYDDFEAVEIKQLRAELCRVTGERDELLVGAQAFCAAINHALSLGMEADAFLRCWNEGDWDGCREFDFPEEAIDLSKGVSP